MKITHSQTYSVQTHLRSNLTKEFTSARVGGYHLFRKAYACLVLSLKKSFHMKPSIHILSLFFFVFIVPQWSLLGSVITDEGSKPEILSRIAQATTALTRLKPVCIDKSISLGPKIWLMRSLVTSIFLHACESWTLTAELQRRIQAMEMRCYRKILRISYKDHVTNKEVHVKIQQAIGPHEDLLTIVKRRKLQCYGHVSRASGLALSLIHIWRCRRLDACRSRWSPYH